LNQPQEKILIIGSQGFIGKNLASILEGEYSIWGCDINMPSEKENRYFQIDEKTSIQDILATGDFTLCINCAGSANVSRSIIFPLDDFTQNTVLVYEILDAIKNTNPKCKFINISSAAVYGNPLILPIRETHPVKPISPYGHHKYLAEIGCREFHQFYQIPACSIRIFSAYGNGQKKLLFWDLFKKLKYDNTPLLFGSGEETRDYIHIIDIAQQIQLVMNHASFEGESYNIANGRQISVKEVVSLMTDLMDIPNTVKFRGDIREGDPCNWMADISYVKDWGYNQQIQLKEGLKTYIEWAEENA
jgi:UDP-glucose 4-epimerase